MRAVGGRGARWPAAGALGGARAPCRRRRRARARIGTRYLCTHVLYWYLVLQMYSVFCILYLVYFKTNAFCILYSVLGTPRGIARRIRHGHGNSYPGQLIPVTLCDFVDCSWVTLVYCLSLIHI